VLEKVIAKERPDAVLPPWRPDGAQRRGGAARTGVLARYGTELIGARIEAIKAGEDRERFKEIVRASPLAGPRATPATCPSTGQPDLPFAGGGLRRRRPARLPGRGPPLLHPGGSGSGIARSKEELRRIAGAGWTPVHHRVLLEESILGWKEFELELMRDRNDNVVVVCSIENIDPMGVHTGDSVTVAPR